MERPAQNDRKFSEIDAGSFDPVGPSGDRVVARLQRVVPVAAVELLPLSFPLIQSAGCSGERSADPASSKLAPRRRWLELRFRSCMLRDCSMNVSSLQGLVVHTRRSIGSRTGPASIVPEVPSTASARTSLKSHERFEMTARTQSHHVAGTVASPKAVIAMAAEPTVAPSSASGLRTPDVPASADYARASSPRLIRWTGDRFSLPSS
jgi:hypothetical protein